MSLLMSEDSEAGLKCSGWVVATLLCQEIPDRALLRRLSLNLPFLCTGTTLMDGMGREEGGVFRVGHTVCGTLTSRPVRELNSCQHTTLPLQVSDRELERDLSELPVSGAGLAHISPAFSLTPVPYNPIHCSFSPRGKKNILHWKSHLFLQSVQEQKISGGVGEMVSK